MRIGAAVEGAGSRKETPDGEYTGAGQSGAVWDPVVIIVTV